MFLNKEKIEKEIKELVNAFGRLREINNNRLLLKIDKKIKQDYENEFKKKEDKNEVK